MPDIVHIQLLSETEISDLYAQPELNHSERKLYFTLTVQELNVLNRYSNTRTRVYFILQLGYFKAKQQFFKFSFENILADVKYILSAFFHNSETILSGQISRNYIVQQRNDILKLFNYQDWLPKLEPQIVAHVCKLLKYYPKSHNALRQLLVYFGNQQIIVPSYRKLQDMFTAAFSLEEKRLRVIILSIPKNQQKELSALVDKEDGISKLNIIRADQKNFQYTAVINEVEKAQDIANLYDFAKNFIPTLGLSKNAVRYYADVAEQYASSRLRRLNKTLQWLYALCFIYHRYQQIMDNLIMSFIHHTRIIMNAGKVYAEEALIKRNSSIVTDFPKLAQFLKWFPKRDEKMTHYELNREAYKILPEEQFSVLVEFFVGTTFDTKAAKWEFYATQSRIFALYLRPILVAVPFVFYKKDSQIMELINLLREH